MRLFRVNKVHKIVFPRPERGGDISNRKRLNADRVYGTKKRVSKSKKVLEVPTIMENDSATDIVMTDANDSGVSDAEHVLNQSFGKLKVWLRVLGHQKLSIEQPILLLKMRLENEPSSN